MELANGQRIKAQAGPSGLPLILNSDLPDNLPAFTEQFPPNAAPFANRWDSVDRESPSLQNVGK
ncbi:hypothetical protein [Rosistilla ulvae]|uniref:hypothetical protein n=1 Tax=Rosistilla ulvae TaxID=1930277 RepID=UPI0011A5AAB4|nr:hypothetical protein [Rosistilla ulvae]